MIYSAPVSLTLNKGFYFRTGSQMQVNGARLSSAIKVNLRSLYGGKRMRSESFSRWRWLGAMMAASVAIYAFFFLAPGFLGSMLIPPKGVLIWQAALVILLPLLPLIYWEYSFHFSPSFSGEVPMPVPKEWISKSENVRGTDSKEDKRWLLIGGSAAEGAPFSKAQSISGWINRICVDRQKPINVINAAVGSSHLQNWLPPISSIVEQTNPEVVLVYFNYNTLFIELSRLPPAFILTANFYHVIRYFNGDRLFAGGRMPRLLDGYDKMVSAIEAGGAKVVVIDDPVAPWFPYLAEYSHFHDMLLAHLREKHVTVIPEFDLFRKENNEYLFYDPCHLIPEGYRRVAEDVLSSLALP